MARNNYDDWNFMGETRKPPVVKKKKETHSSVATSFIYLCTVLALVLLGLVCMYSASYPEAIKHGLPHYYYFSRQVIFAVLALVLGLVINIIPVNWIKKASLLFLIVCFILMLLTLYTPFGETRLGARRWLNLGPLPSFQPTEFVKIAIILYLALYFSNRNNSCLKIKESIFPAIVCMLFAVLILLQKDFSSAMVFLGICISMFAAGGVALGSLIAVLAFVAVPAVGAILIAPYRVKRIVAFLIPDIDPSGISYQVTNSKAAIAGGSWFGKGLGNGTYKNGLLPEVQSDFILSNIAEELGFVGIAFIFLLFALFCYIGYRSARKIRTQDMFLSNCAFGITTMIVWQAMVNAAVVTGLVPPTGIPLPFFSQGGTNLMVVICECAFVYRITRLSSQKGDNEESIAEIQDKFLFPEKHEYENY